MLRRTERTQCSTIPKLRHSVHSRMPSNTTSTVIQRQSRLGDREDAWYWSILPKSCIKYIQVTIRPQAVRLIVLIAMFLLSLVLVNQWLGMDEKNEVVRVDVPKSGAQQPSGELSEATQRPQRGKIRQLGELDTTLIPGNSFETTSGHGRRLIFIGDIHGCYEELVQLLSEAEYDAATDHIVAAGDMVNKGPRSGAVIDFLMSQGASCVRGNHDDRILLKHVMPVSAHIPGVPEDPEMTLARSLTPSQVSYLNSCPIVLRVGTVPSHGNILVVHAGLIPSLELVDQDPVSVMNMRIIDPLTHVPSKEHEREGHVPWAEFWNQEQTRKHDSGSLGTNRHRGTTVIYGHDAKRGLQIQKYTKGLDSGCYRGRELTALILSNNAEEKVVQVRCHQYV